MCVGVGVHGFEFNKSNFQSFVFILFMNPYEKASSNDLQISHFLFSSFSSLSQPLTSSWELSVSTDPPLARCTYKLRDNLLLTIIVDVSSAFYPGQAPKLFLGFASFKVIHIIFQAWCCCQNKIRWIRIALPPHKASIRWWLCRQAWFFELNSHYH